MIFWYTGENICEIISIKACQKGHSQDLYFISLLWRRCAFFELNTRVYIIFWISKLGKLKKMYFLGRRQKTWKRIYCCLNVLKYLLKEVLLLIPYTYQYCELIALNTSAGSRHTKDNSATIKNRWHSRSKSREWVISVEPLVCPNQNVNETVYKNFMIKSNCFSILDQKALVIKTSSNW